MHAPYLPAHRLHYYVGIESGLWFRLGISLQAWPRPRAEGGEEPKTRAGRGPGRGVGPALCASVRVGTLWPHKHQSGAAPEFGEVSETSQTGKGKGVALPLLGLE